MTGLLCLRNPHDGGARQLLPVRRPGASGRMNGVEMAAPTGSGRSARTTPSQVDGAAPVAQPPRIEGRSPTDRLFRGRADQATALPRGRTSVSSPRRRQRVARERRGAKGRPFPLLRSRRRRCAGARWHGGSESAPSPGRRFALAQGLWGTTAAGATPLCVGCAGARALGGDPTSKSAEPLRSTGDANASVRCNKVRSAGY